MKSCIRSCTHHTLLSERTLTLVMKKEEIIRCWRNMLRNMAIQLMWSRKHITKTGRSAALFLPAAHLLLTALFLSAAVPLLYLLLCYLLSLPLPVIQVPSSVPAASPRNSGKTYNYPVSPDNSSYISSSLPRFHKSQFSLSQSTDQFAHLFVLRLYFLYHNINITKKLVSSLKINTFLFPNGFLPSVLQFPHQDNPEDNFSDLPACPDALL